jgi:hypothetical protein
MEREREREREGREREREREREGSYITLFDEEHLNQTHSLR